MDTLIIVLSGIGLAIIIGVVVILAKGINVQ